MPATDPSQTFLFIFRPNGEAHGELLAEVLVEELADYDPSVAADSYKSTWAGTESALQAVLEQLGFVGLDIEGVMGALRSHRDADRRLPVTREQLQAAGFRQAE